MGQIPGSIDAAISKITIAFNLTSTTGLYVTTVACLVSVAFSVLLGFVAGKRVGYRPLILFCATVELVSALIPFFTSNFVILIIMRGIFGIGFGGMQSIENTVAATLIPPKRRAAVIGQGMCFGFGMNCILQFVGGLLADIGWNYVFLNHLLLLIPYAVVLAGCAKLDFSPVGEKREKALGDDADAGAEADAADLAAGADTAVEAADAAADAESNKLGAPVYQVWVMMLFVGVFIAPLLVGCSFLSDAIVESATAAGVVAVFFSVGCMVGGLVYAKIYERLQKMAMPAFLLLMVVGLVGCGVARSIPALCALIFIAGMSFSMTQSMGMMILSLSCSPARIALASAIMMALYNLGMFLSSSFEEAVGALTGDELYLPLFLGAAVLAVFAVAYAVFSPLGRGEGKASARA